MSHRSDPSNSVCYSDCDQAFRRCLERGEHESVCRMQQVPCICRCRSEES